MSKFTKYCERALDSAKPHKEAGMVLALTSEGYYMAQVVGDPRVVGQCLAIALDSDAEGITDVITELLGQLDEEQVKQLILYLQ